MNLTASPMASMVPAVLKEIKAALFQGFNSLNQLKKCMAASFVMASIKTNLINMLLQSSFKFNDPNYAKLIFYQTKEPNVFLWNTMIRGLVSKDSFHQAVEFFYSMPKSPMFSLGSSIGKNVFVSTSLVDMYTKLGCMERARAVFDEMFEKDIVSWSAMIQGYAANGLPGEALELFYQMQRENLKRDRYAMVGVLSACAWLMMVAGIFAA